MAGTDKVLALSRILTEPGMTSIPLSFIHSLSDGKVSVEYFLFARYCGEYGDPRKSPGFEEFEARKDRSKKIIST